jgi:hypothetical protein
MLIHEFLALLILAGAIVLLVWLIKDGGTRGGQGGQ